MMKQHDSTSTQSKNPQWSYDSWRSVDFLTPWVQRSDGRIPIPPTMYGTYLWFFKSIHLDHKCPWKMKGFKPPIFISPITPKNEGNMGSHGRSYTNWVVKISNVFISRPIWGNDPIWLPHTVQMGWNVQPPTRTSIHCLKTNMSPLKMLVSNRHGTFSKGLFGGFLKWWYPTTMGFPTKNDNSEVFWGYHHLRKHPFSGFQKKQRADFCEKKNSTRKEAMQHLIEGIEALEEVCRWLW